MARRRHDEPRTLVAAASRVNLGDKKQAQAQAPKRAAWQEEAWAYFDDVPEIKYSTWFLGNAMAKLRLFVATVPLADPDGDPVPVSDPAARPEGADAGQVADPSSTQAGAVRTLGPLPDGLAEQAEAELARLNRGLGGLPGIQRNLNMNIEVAAECYLVGQAERPESVPGKGDGLPERWQIRSVSEVVVREGKYRIKASENDQSPVELDPDKDTVIRLWQQHPRWAALADCAMRGVLGEAEALLILENELKAVGKSRQQAGILTVPNELSFEPAEPTEGDDTEDDEDPFSTELATAISDAVADPGSASAAMPLVVRGPAEYLQPKYLRHITLERKADSSLDDRIEKRVQRIARGLNLPVEVVMGHQATTYANAEQVDQDTYDDHLDPRAILICDMLTVGFLRPQLLDAGINPDDVDRVFVWFDPSALIRQPDPDANADSGHEKGTISDQAWRKAKGFSEDDAPTAAELLIRLATQRGQVSAPLTVALIKALADEAGVDLPNPKDVQPERPAPAPASIHTVGDLAALLVENGRVVDAASRRTELAAAARRSSTGLGARLMGIDRDLRTRLIAHCDAAMGRAIERAGNKLRRQSAHVETLRTVPPRLAAAHLGPSIIRAAGGDPDHLLDAEFDPLEATFMEQGAAAQADALSALDGAADLDPATLDSVHAQQEADLADAWLWLKGELVALGTARLFDPSPTAPPVGEYDGTTSVPAGMVRQAIARAGGASGMESAGASGAWVAMVQGGSQPAGGIGTGQVITGLVGQLGGGIDGYRWVYGPAHRSQPYEPHVDLDGTEFPNFDDDSLGNGDNWPPFSYYMPGDHAGCLCDFEPMISLPGDDSADAA